MKTPEEIKLGLECCNGGDECRECPYDDVGATVTACTSKLAEDALAYIQQLEAQLVNQATEYSRALKITTEQRDMLMGTQDKLAELLSYVTGGRFSKTSYSIDKMERFVDDYQQSECAKCDELAQVKAERDRYWQYIKGLGCDTCGGDCDRCEVGLDRVWSGWVWAGEREEVIE